MSDTSVLKTKKVYFILSAVLSVITAVSADRLNLISGRQVLSDFLVPLLGIIPLLGLSWFGLSRNISNKLAVLLSLIWVILALIYGLGVLIGGVGSSFTYVSGRDAEMDVGGVLLQTFALLFVTTTIFIMGLWVARKNINSK